MHLVPNEGVFQQILKEWEWKNLLLNILKIQVSEISLVVFVALVKMLLCLILGPGTTWYACLTSWAPRAVWIEWICAHGSCRKCLLFCCELTIEANTVLCVKLTCNCWPWLYVHSCVKGSHIHKSRKIELHSEWTGWRWLLDTWLLFMRLNAESTEGTEKWRTFSWFWIKFLGSEIFPPEFPCVWTGVR